MFTGRRRKRKSRRRGTRNTKKTVGKPLGSH